MRLLLEYRLEIFCCINSRCIRFFFKIVIISSSLSKESLYNEFASWIFDNSSSVFRFNWCYHFAQKIVHAKKVVIVKTSLIDVQGILFFHPRSSISLNESRNCEHTFSGDIQNIWRISIFGCYWRWFVRNHTRFIFDSFEIILIELIAIW